MMQRFAVAALLLLSSVGGPGCKKKQREQAGDGSAATAVAPKAEPAKEVADTAEPPGVTWKRIELPFGSMELPIDPGWALVGTEIHGPDGIVIMMQAQDGITPEQRDDYLASYDEVQKRDAPRYSGTAVAKGTVGGAVAARVEGTFDNGTAFVTRDFLVFSKGKVVVIGARIPQASAAKLPAIIDHAVRTLQVK